MTIAIGGTSELFNAGGITVNGGSLLITVDGSAMGGGYALGNGIIVIEGGGTLETHAAYGSGASGSPDLFLRRLRHPGNTLKIDTRVFGGASPASASDTIDLGTSLAVGTLVYSSATSMLSLENNGGTDSGVVHARVRRVPPARSRSAAAPPTASSSAPSSSPATPC